MLALLTALALTVSNSTPEIQQFCTMVSPGDALSLDGEVADVDEDLSGVIVQIDWLGVEYEVPCNVDGHFEWHYDLEPGDEGWVTAVAVDSGGLESLPVEDLITQAP